MDLSKATEKERVEYYIKHRVGKEPTKFVIGAFGDMEGCVGVVEEEIFPEEGGSFVKYLGCSYYQQGCPLGMIPMQLIEAYGVVKGIILASIEQTMKHKTIFFFIFFFWLFLRKKFYEIINIYAEILYSKTIRALHNDSPNRGYSSFPPKRYGILAREFKKGIKSAIQKEYDWDEFHRLAETPLVYIKDKLKDKKLRILLPIFKISEIALLTIELDTAYKYPIQDGAENFNKNAKDKIEEFIRIIRLIGSRYVQPSNSDKFYAFAKALKIAKYIPFFKRFLLNFIEAVDWEKLRFTEADWYFVLRRNQYNFRGIPVEERLKEADRIDREKGHVRINFRTVDKEEFEKTAFQAQGMGITL